MRQWTLAFHAGCAKCREAAVGVQAEAPSPLSVRSLTDPDVRELRRKAFGGRAPWAPTLLAVSGDHVRAWTGPMLAVRLAFLLGPKRSLRVIRNIKHAVIIPNSTARSRVLRVVPGLATGLFLLSGGASLPGQRATLNMLDGDSAAEVLRHAEQDEDFSRLRAHLELQGYRECAQYVLEGERSGGVRRGIRSKFRGPGDSSARLVYAYEPGAKPHLIAVTEEGGDEQVLTMRNGQVVPWERRVTDRFD